MKEYECPYCRTIQTEDEMELDEHDEPAYCFMCGRLLIEDESLFISDFDTYCEEPGWG